MVVRDKSATLRSAFRRVLRRNGLRRCRQLPLISEAEHLHHTTGGYADEFRQLAMRLGVGDFDRVYSDEANW